MTQYQEDGRRAGTHEGHVLCWAFACTAAACAFASTLPPSFVSGVLGSPSSSRTVAQLSRWRISFEPRAENHAAARQRWSERVFQGAIRKRARFTFCVARAGGGGGRGGGWIDAFGPPPPHQLPLVRTAIEKLTSSGTKQSDKNANKRGGGGRTRP